MSNNVVSFPMEEKKKEARMVDPLASTDIKKLISEWYCFSAGGTYVYSFELLKALNLQTDSYLVKGVPKDPLRNKSLSAYRELSPRSTLQFKTPELMLSLQPIIVAWARDQRCDIPYIESAAIMYSAVFLWSTVNELVKTGAVIRIGPMSPIDHGPSTSYLPARNVLYDTLETLRVRRIFWETYQAEHIAGLDMLEGENVWPSTDTLPPTPTTYNDKESDFANR